MFVNTSTCTKFTRTVSSLCSISSCLPQSSVESRSGSLIKKRCFRILSETSVKNVKLSEHKVSLFKLHSKRRETTLANSDDVTIVYEHGLPVISLSLPSKHERCSFTLRPLMSTVGQFLDDLKAEDRGIDTAVIYRPDGVRVASTTQIEHLLLGRFKLSINNITYDVQPPPMDESSSEHITQLHDIKQLVVRLYSNLNVDQYCLQKEQEVLGRLENLQTQIEPLEKVKQELEAKASFRTNLVIWGGLAFMASQFGILARLTWWEYSWDIMEPVTYFITYGTAMIMYAYFILTKQEYVYPDARDRQFLHFIYKEANKSRFDIAAYNSLCNQIAEAEKDLKKLRERAP